MRGRRARMTVLVMLLLAGGAAFTATGRPQYQRQPASPYTSSMVDTAAGGRSLSGAGVAQRGLDEHPAAGVSVPERSETAAVQEEFSAGLARRPDDPAQLRALARELRSLDPEAGEQAYASLLEEYPEDAASLTGLAAAHFDRGDRKAAMRLVRQALALSPRLPEARLLHGLLLISDQPPDTARAIEEWNAVLESGTSTDTGREAARLIAVYEGR